VPHDPWNQSQRSPSGRSSPRAPLRAEVGSPNWPHFVEFSEDAQETPGVVSSATWRYGRVGPRCTPLVGLRGSVEEMAELVEGPRRRRLSPEVGSASATPVNMDGLHPCRSPRRSGVYAKGQAPHEVKAWSCSQETVHSNAVGSAVRGRGHSDDHTWSFIPDSREHCPQSTDSAGLEMRTGLASVSKDLDDVRLGMSCMDLPADLSGVSSESSCDSRSTSVGPSSSSGPLSSSSSGEGIKGLASKREVRTVQQLGGVAHTEFVAGAASDQLWNPLYTSALDAIGMAAASPSHAADCNSRNQEIEPLEPEAEPKEPLTEGDCLGVEVVCVCPYSHDQGMSQCPSTRSPSSRSCSSFAETATGNTFGPWHAEIGVHTLCGRKRMHPRWVNQDAHLRKELPDGRWLVAVFDGHGEWGHLISHRACELFDEISPFHLGAGRGCSVDSFDQLFAQTQAVLASEGLSALSGTTASCAVIDSEAQTVVFAHVGDSTMLLTKDGEVVYGTHDHKFDQESERRIQCWGGEIRHEKGGRRLFARGMPGPGLAVGRALGDLEASKLGLLSKPAVSPSFHFGPGSSLVVASDGVWDMITREEAAVLLLEAESPQSAACDLVADARKNWLVHGDIDDITALVVEPALL